MNLVVRSTTVPIAERFSPRLESSRAVVAGSVAVIVVPPAQRRAWNTFTTEPNPIPGSTAPSRVVFGRTPNSAHAGSMSNCQTSAAADKLRVESGPAGEGPLTRSRCLTDRGPTA